MSWALYIFSVLLVIIYFKVKRFVCDEGKTQSVIKNHWVIKNTLYMAYNNPVGIHHCLHILICMWTIKIHHFFVNLEKPFGVLTHTPLTHSYRIIQSFHFVRARFLLDHTQYVVCYIFPFEKWYKNGLYISEFCNWKLLKSPSFNQGEQSFYLLLFRENLDWNRGSIWKKKN